MVTKVRCVKIDNEFKNPNRMARVHPKLQKTPKKAFYLKDKYVTHF